MKIQIKQHLSTPTESELNSTNQLILVFPASIKSEKWPNIAHKAALKARYKRNSEPNTQFELDLPNKVSTQTSVAAISKDINQFDLLTLARKLVATQLKSNPTSISIAMPGLTAKQAGQVAESMLSAILAANENMPSFKSKQPAKRLLKTVHLFNQKQKLDTRVCQATAKGNNLARALTTLPPNELTPGNYRKQVVKLARQHNWKMQFHNMASLRKQKAGAFVAVAQGSPEADAGIVHLRYTPKKKTNKAACSLVGKGICFDTGGTNLKPAQYMHGMHEDMEGSAVALGTLLALSALKVDFPVDCWLALAQNHIGPKAYKQNDVVTAYNGTTIEIMHTDAEGRMVLADTLSLAAKKKPAVIIDYATLTGSCVAALGTTYSGAFTNQDGLFNSIIDAGKNSGERVWPFPIDEDFDSTLDSEIADIKQCTITGGPDHILASRFLSRFVDKTPWLHVDLSSGNNKGGLAHIPTAITGFGIRFTVNLLLEENLLEKVKPVA